MRDTLVIIAIIVSAAMWINSQQDYFTNVLDPSKSTANTQKHISTQKHASLYPSKLRVSQAPSQINKPKHLHHRRSNAKGKYRAHSKSSSRNASNLSRKQRQKRSEPAKQFTQDSQAKSLLTIYKDPQVKSNNAGTNSSNSNTSKHTQLGDIQGATGQETVVSGVHIESWILSQQNAIKSIASAEIEGPALQIYVQCMKRQDPDWVAVEHGECKKRQTRNKLVAREGHLNRGARLQ